MKHEKYYVSQKEATARYNKKTYDRINIIVKKVSGRSSKTLPPVREKA